MPKFNVTYFLLTVLLFITELAIGFYLHDALIRPYGGDVLVVILLYCAVRSVIDLSPLTTGLGVLAFAFIVEFLQYLNLVAVLGLQDYQVARVIIGTSFSFADLFCYALGIITVLLIENVFNHEPIFKK